MRYSVDIGRLQQDDSDLAITGTDSGHRVDGTVSGNRIHRQNRKDLIDFEAGWKGRGTALTEDVVALTITHEFSSEEVERALVCEMPLERMMDAPAECIVGIGTGE